ncbi:MAG: HAD-IC family P-type ATPase [Oscillospiraceae bacterium]
MQELFALETLAHVDILCLDKTGTLTDGRMAVEEVLQLSPNPGLPLEKLMASFLQATADNNATFLALANYFNADAVYSAVSSIPFSSERKWSAVTFAEEGTLVIGAPEKLLRGALPPALQQAAAQGKRVLLAGIAEGEIINQTLPNIRLLAAFIIVDPIRKNAAKTLAFFEKEGVAIKIISGDTIATVSALAKQAGFAHSDKCIDLSKLTDEEVESAAISYSVFGRVSPHQKRLIVKALQKNKKTVAMTGDGVNDLLALREADCSIGIAEGSDAVKQISNLVLVDSNFASLPKVLHEGRRVVNNITRLSGVFFVKTIYSVVLCLLCIVFNVPFPFIPLQITLIDLAIEGYPAFFLSFEPDNRKITGRFLPNVLQRALPVALGFIVTYLAVTLLAPVLNIATAQAGLLLYLLVGTAGIIAVFKSCIPFNKLRVSLCSTMTMGFVAAVLLFHTMLSLPLPSTHNLLLYLGFALLLFIVQAIASPVCSHIMHRFYNKKESI